MSTNVVLLGDHLDGFTEEFDNEFLSKLNENPTTVQTEYIVDQRIQNKYKNLDIKFNLDLWLAGNAISSLDKFNRKESDKDIKNFVCSFNGSDNASRQLLTSILFKYKWFDPTYCSKNFATSKDSVDGYISASFKDPNQESFYRRFIISDDDEFYKTVISHHYTQHDHLNNLETLYDKIHSSFVQIVGETTGTQYYPFVTEKIFYPIIGKTLWLAYAQPGYHEHVAKYFGFRKYDKIFDYTFDSITNPIFRLVELIRMVARYEKLSKSDLHDLYLLEYDTIQYNYELFYSGQYIDRLK